MLLVAGKQMLLHMADARAEAARTGDVGTSEDYPLMKQDQKRRRVRKMDDLLALLKRYTTSDPKIADLHKTLIDFVRIKSLEHKDRQGKYGADGRKPLTVRTTQEWTPNYPTNNQAHRINNLLKGIDR